MSACKGGAGASSLLPCMVSLPRSPSPLIHPNFMANEPSGSINPGPPGLNTTVPSGHSPTNKAGFQREVPGSKKLIASLPVVRIPNDLALRGSVTGQVAGAVLVVL